MEPWKIIISVAPIAWEEVEPEEKTTGNKRPIQARLGKNIKHRGGLYRD